MSGHHGEFMEPVLKGNHLFYFHFFEIPAPGAAQGKGCQGWILGLFVFSFDILGPYDSTRGPRGTRPYCLAETDASAHIREFRDAILEDTCIFQFVFSGSPPHKKILLF